MAQTIMSCCGDHVVRRVVYALLVTGCGVIYGGVGEDIFLEGKLFHRIGFWRRSLLTKRGKNVSTFFTFLSYFYIEDDKSIAKDMDKK